MTAIQAFPLPLLGFAAASGTGKTTLLEKLIPLLVQQGIRVALIKHSHHDIELDILGKDSYRLRKAGASQVVLAGIHRSICFYEHNKNDDVELMKQLALLDTNTVDLVLVEGFRDQAFPKIELHRRELHQPYLYPNDPHIIALVSDHLSSPSDLPTFTFEALEALVDFIKQQCQLIQSI